MAAIQNIKILHKRYSSAQWQNGITVNGETIIPMLAQGEIGLATDTLEVRIGTLAGSEQTFAQAKPIGTDLEIKAYGKADNGSWVEVDAQPAGTVVVKVEEKSSTTAHDSKHEIHVYYDKISIGAISDFPDFNVKVVKDATAGDGEVKVVSKAEENTEKEHELNIEYATAATKNYVDSQLTNAIKPLQDSKLDSLTDTDDGVVILETSKNGTTGTIDAKHKKYNGSNTPLTAETAGAGDSVTIPVQTITYDTYGHVSGSTTQDITINIPDFTDIPNVSVGSNDASATKVLTQVKMTDGTLSGSTKDIVKKTGSKVTVEGTADEIQVGVDLSDYVTKTELSEAVNGAMDFAGTITVVGGTTTELSTLTDKTNGATYLITTTSGTDGYYAIKDSVNGIHEPGNHTTATKNNVEVKAGDMVIFHIMSDGSQHWELIPAADDYDNTFRPIAANGELIWTDVRDGSALDISAANNGIAVTTKTVTLTDVGESAESIQISHANTSDVEDLSKATRTYVDGLTFDEFGHVTGYSVSTETVVDTNDNTSHSHTAGAKLELTDGNGGIDGNVGYAHIEIPTTTENDASKKATVTAGSGATFSVVDSLENDGYGHITKVVTKDVQINVPQDTNTLYDITGGSIEEGAQITLNPSDNLDAASNVQITGSGATTVSFADGKIVISSNDTTYELATEALAGLLKVANVLNETASQNATVLKNYTGNNNNNLYGVNRRTDGTAFVEVPWTDTKYTASNGVKMVETTVQHDVAQVAATAVDMYAFATDANGHARDMVAITTIDGNYA